MDPNTALVEALKSLLDPANDPDNRNAASEHLRDLADWLDNGGFAPDVLAALDLVKEAS